MHGKNIVLITLCVVVDFMHCKRPMSLVVYERNGLLAIYLARSYLFIWFFEKPFFLVIPLGALNSTVWARFSFVPLINDSNVLYRVYLVQLGIILVMFFFYLVYL